MVEHQRVYPLGRLVVRVVVELVALRVGVGEGLRDDVVRATRRTTDEAQVVRAYF